MKIRDIDITQTIRDALPVDSFLFNPSIAHLTGDTYLVSVRSYIHDIDKPFDDNPKLVDNPQHPWGTDWDGTDVTYILPIVLTKDSVQPITTGAWPLEIPVQDMRIFKFMKDDTRAVFILTYNERYKGHQDMIIKGGDSCQDFCYLIGWSYLIVDINSLNYYYIPGQKPLCMNISNPVEKNWSLWRYQREKIYLLISYALTPVHTAFSMKIDGIEDGELVGSSTCRMVTVQPGKEDNLLGELEKYYHQKLLVSLSTPSYEIDSDNYQAVGHLKVKIEYIKKLAKSNKRTPLAKFAQDYIKGGKRYYNPNYVYLMFVYRFQVREKAEPTAAGAIELTDSNNQIHAAITHITPAFVSKVSDYDYFLNFPSGMVLNDENTIISYGNGDATAHLLFMPNDELEQFLVPVADLTAAKFEFIHAEKNTKGMITL